MKNHIKNLISFLFCFLVAAILTYEISGTGGIFIMTLLMTALILSGCIMLVSVKTVRVTLELSTDIVSKGESFEAEIVIDKKTFLPTSFVEVEMGCSPNIGLSEDSVRFKLISAKRGGERFKVSLNADLCGLGEVYVKSLGLSDYLGIFGKKIRSEAESREVKIIPRIPDTGSQAEVIKSTSENMSFDDSDEESDETAVGLTGVPGYEHRNYVQGDPLKRVNWKLSSKRDQLMVRLDEKVTSSSQIFLLDYPERESPDRAYYENADMIIEASLAMLSILLRAGFESEFNYYLDGWEMVDVKDEKSLQYLQERLAGIKPYPFENRIPDKNINAKGKAQLCFTACMSDMRKELEILLDGFSGSLVVTKNSGIGKVKADMWTVDGDFEFMKMQ
ncbi:MAG: DUF58 domain-containing protein [Ruminococcus sp.]|nr:DUF58 domain-containing protein [Ruminococcus sp.]